MPLSNDLITKFVKTTNDRPKAKKESTTYGTIVKVGGENKLHIDGAYDQNGEPIYQPILSTVETMEGDRVIVSIKNHMAVVTGNLKSPSTTVEKVNEVQTTITKKIETDYLTAKEIDAHYVKTDTLESDYMKADVIDGKYARLDEAKIKYAEFDTVKSDFGAFKETYTEKLEAAEGDIDDLEADTAHINKVMFGSAAGTTLQTSFANAVVALLGDAKIKSAMIESLSANKIDAGSIDTDKVQLASEDGSLVIFENLIQIKDGQNVRVQIGKDAAGNYSILICDENGATMLDASGITENAIKEAIIVNDMIAEDANISGSKIDITSLITEINNSSTTIKSSRIYFDDKSQTLEVAFKELSDDVTANGAQITALSDKITSKVWQQDIEATTYEGRNLLRDSRHMDLVSASSTSYPVTKTLMTENGREFYRYVRLSGTQTRTMGLYCSTPVTQLTKVLTGKEVTFSFYIRCNRATTTTVYSELRDGNGTILETFGGTTQSVSIGPEWTRVSITEYIDAEYDSQDTLRFCPQYVTIPEGDWENFYLDVCEWKIEFGSTATEWSLAPEDMNLELQSIGRDLYGLTMADGQNLLRDSKHIELWSPNVNECPFERTLMEENGIEFYRYRRLAGTSKGHMGLVNTIPVTQLTKILSGKEVTFSCWVRASHNTTSNRFATIIDNVDSLENPKGSEDFGTAYGDKVHTITTEWTRFTATEFIDLNYEYDSRNIFRFCPQYITIPNNDWENFYCDIRDWKVEFGSKATDWTPAPEDTQEDIQQLTTKYSSIEQDVDSITSTVVNHTAEISEHGTKLEVSQTIVNQLVDTISTLVTDGNGTSLMTQTENGWTFSTAEIEDAVNNAAESLDVLTKEQADTSNTVSILQQAVNDLGVLAEYVKIGTYGGEPCIELGESDSNFKLRITNTRIVFMDGTDIPAYINNKSLNIKKAVIEEELHQGEWIWKARKNGNIGLMWKGATN